MTKEKMPAPSELSERDLEQAVGGAPQPGKTLGADLIGSGLAPDGGAALNDWIKASFDQGFAEKNMELIAANFDSKARAVRVFSDSVL